MQTRTRFDLLVEEELKKADIDKDVSVGGQKETVISPGLKIKHKKSGFLYTIARVNPDDVLLKTPEGKHIIVDTDTLENEYALG